MDFRVLGVTQVVEGAAELAVGGPKQRTVLALLVASVGRPVTTDALVDGVYGDAAAPGARRSVQTYVSNLRGTTGGRIEPSGRGYLLRATAADVDAGRFTRAVEQASELSEPEVRSAALRDALGTWRGHAYADVDAFHTIDAEVARLTELRLLAVERRVDADLEQGLHDQLVPELEALAAAHPTREHLRYQHMLALYRSGRQAEALRSYRTARELLVEQAGIDPSHELQALADRMLAQDPSLAAPTAATLRRAAILVGDVEDGAVRFGAALDDVAAAHGGDVFAVRGPASYVRFPSTVDAARAATALQRVLARGGSDALARLAIDVGYVEEVGRSAVSGPPVLRGARLAGAAHFGQVVLSSDAVDELTATPGEWVLRGLGEHDLLGVDGTTRVHQLDVEGLPTSFPALADGGHAPPMPGRPPAAPGYEVRDAVGGSADGVVHRGYQPSIGREVTITVARSDLVDDPQFVRRFEADAHAAARIEHPRVVPLVDYWREPGVALLVRRWTWGGSLAERVAAGRTLSSSDVAALVSDVGGALDHLERRGIVPVTLAPADVFVGEGDTFHVGALGLGRPRPEPAGSASTAAACLARLVGRLVVVDDLSDELADLVRSTRDGNGLDVAAFVAAWLDATYPGGAGEAPVPDDVRNPYKGLASFTEADRGDFFGRHDLVDEILDGLKAHALVAAVGPSGIGKSSLVRAGVVPRVRQGGLAGSDGWLVVDVVPGADPLGALAAGLRRVAVREVGELAPAGGDDRGLARAIERCLPNAPLLLVIDQFEEVFTHAPDDVVPDRFLRMLVAAVGEDPERLRVLVTLRADHFDLPLEHPELGALLRSATVVVHGPDDDELREIVRAPAARVGVTVDPDIVERLVADVRAAPGGLPLLQFGLTELFERRDGGRITTAVHDAVGGVVGVVARRAEAAMEELGARGAEVARLVFLSLVTVRGQAVVRRRVRTADLHRGVGDPGAIERVLGAFGAARLLTFDRDATTRTPTVELAHEALVTGWPRLAGWIADTRGDLLQHERLADVTREWLASDRGDAFLLERGRLAQHEAWSATTSLRLHPLERELLDASRAAEDRRARTARRRRTTITSLIAAAAVVALVLAGTARVARDEAARQRDVADARRLLASSGEIADRDPELGLLLAIEAAERLPGDPEAAAALHAAAARNRTLLSRTWPDERAVNTQVDLAADGSLMVWAGQPGGLVEAIDVDTGTVRWQHEVAVEDPGDVIVRPQFVRGDRELLVAVQYSPRDAQGADDVPEGVGLHVLDVETGEVVRELPSGPCGAWLAAAGVEWAAVVSTDGADHVLVNQYAAAHVAEHGCPQLGSAPASIDVVRVDVVTGEQRPVVTSLPVTRVVAYSALSLDGRVAAVDPGRGVRTVLDVESGEVLLELPDAPAEGPVGLSADGSLVAVSADGDPHRTAIHDVASGQRVATTTGHEPGVQLFTARFSRDGTWLVTTSADGTARMWSTNTGEEVDRVRGFDAPAVEPRLSEDRSRLLLSSFGPEVLLVDLTPGGRPELPLLDACRGTEARDVVWHPGGLRWVGGALVTHVSCAASREPGRLRILDPNTGVIATDLPALGLFSAVSDDGSRALTQAWSREEGSVPGGRLVVHDTANGARVAELDGLCSWDWAAIPPAAVEEYDFGAAAGSECRPAPELPFPGSNEGMALAAGNDLAAAVVGSPEGARVVVAEVETGTVRGLVPGDSATFVAGGRELLVHELVGRRLVVYDTTSLDVVRQHDVTDLPLFEDLHDVPGRGEVLARTTHLAEARILRFDAETLELVDQHREAHAAEITDLAVNELAGVIVTGGADGRARVWDLATTRLVHEVAIGAPVVAATVSDDGRVLYTTTRSGPARAWVLDHAELLELARARSNRGFTAAECTRYFDDATCPGAPEGGSRAGRAPDQAIGM